MFCRSFRPFLALPWDNFYESETAAAPKRMTKSRKESVQIGREEE